ncbi:transporter of the HlyC/CorC family [Corynebacterium jeikeium]|uniref:Putative membrane protein n=1 Tax=Corynebacterium jeikeium (strain K411) TaxID=306537 RepID=Q4JWP3_CORJK|nr:hemolysin family protein [Corynebacterium jeikeium]CAI36764.1 putative membrane protein [Corynebacterium jeikeium K411]SUY85881.1 transporter of the HlyC/CorC family [Corynebacterium jeikeium]
MTIDIPLSIPFAILALFLGGVLSLVETAVSSLSAARVENLVKEDRPGAARLERVLEGRAGHINLLVLLRTICEVSGAVLAAAACVELMGSRGWAFATAIVIVTLLTFILIGVLSRTLGRQNPYTISLATAPILLGLSKLLGPIAKLLVGAGNVLTPGRGFRNGPFASEIELREMVDIASERGVVEMDERRMIQSVFDLADTSARSVMVPRPEMVWIEADKTAGQATSLCVRTGLSRLPVVGDDVDDIVGVIYLKDLIAETYHMTDGGSSIRVRDCMRPAVFVPDSKKLDDLLEDMQRDQIHIAMLIDEYGAVAGLISIEDILEEIVGEITDEYDTSEQAPIEPLEDGSYRVQARLSLEELEELFEDVEFSEEQHEEVDTVYGLGAFELGRVPIPGAEISTTGLHLRYEGGRDRRGRVKIRTAVVTREKQVEGTGDAGHDGEVVEGMAVAASTRNSAQDKAQEKTQDKSASDKGQQ